MGLRALCAGCAERQARLIAKAKRMARSVTDNTKQVFVVSSGKTQPQKEKSE